MKKILSVTLLFALVISTLLCSCTPSYGDLWDTALYNEDTVLGEGAKTVTVTVRAQDREVVFTIKTDRDILGDALMDHELVAGDAGAYGLYIKSVNGIVADYDVDGYYWGFYKGGEFMLTGVDGTAIVGGESFELVREK